MGLTYEQRINSAKEYLESHGYIVKKDYSTFIGKWIAFEQRGINKIMHGRIESTTLESKLLVVKCKNREWRYIEPEQILGFFENKKECYEFTGEISWR